MDYDKILVMAAGEVAQYDTPQNLLSDQSGIFYSMAKDANIIWSLPRVPSGSVPRLDWIILFSNFSFMF